MLDETGIGIALDEKLNLFGFGSIRMKMSTSPSVRGGARAVVHVKTSGSLEEDDGVMRLFILLESPTYNDLVSHSLFSILLSWPL